MKRYRSSIYRGIMLLATTLVSAAVAVPAFAQEGDGGRGGLEGYAAVGRAPAPAGGPQCPQIAWHIIRLGGPSSGNLAGVVMFNDLSGVSTARGTISPEGQFSMVLTSVQGVGPTGAATGTRGTDGSIMGDLNGPGCSKLKLRIRPMFYPAGSG